MFTYLTGDVGFEIPTDEFNAMLKNYGSDFFKMINKNTINIYACEVRSYDNGFEIVTKDFDKARKYCLENKDDLNYTFGIENDKTRIFVYLNTINQFENTIFYIDDYRKSNIYCVDPVEFRVILDSFKG